MNVRGAALLMAPAAAAVWAFWPARVPELPAWSDNEPPHISAKEVTLAALDSGAFRAPLWVAPPAPPIPPAPAAPPPPLKLQLLALVHEDGVYRAMLYDPDADKVVVVREGESVGARRVEKVSASGVQIWDGALGLRTLALKEQEGRP